MAKLCRLSSKFFFLPVVSFPTVPLKALVGTSTVLTDKKKAKKKELKENKDTHGDNAARFQAGMTKRKRKEEEGSPNQEKEHGERGRESLVKTCLWVGFLKLRGRKEWKRGVQHNECTRVLSSS